MSDGDDRGSDCPSLNAVENALARLAQKGLELFWVRDEAGVLFDLTSVQQRAKRDFDGGEDALPLALIACLREQVESLEPAQHRKILWIVLDFDGENKETSAMHRRSIAGQQFRDGSQPVTWGTIRQHHEPKARRKLARMLLALEPDTQAAKT